ncbi:FAD-binding oxidoreductase [Aspergillus affinis]|uniref:FAD-binding oxidoreductase n=1 Tax=Aspergillus affinis TaxID=1070780 RepID=UPI0022FE6D7F|nr:FAD-binding oxidoreductase [Aspergillus affinis]KAI9041050.1 FAD-binding oxidoreductase [Aspergillus affinis]
MPSQVNSLDGDLDTKTAKLNEFKAVLEKYAVHVQVTTRESLHPNAMMHDRAAVIPALVVSPKSEWGVSKALTLMTDRKLYDHFEVSVKSGGHGYFNGASCQDIMLNMASMNQRRIVGDTMFLEPGCVLAQVIDILAKHGKAVPHGDCFGVGAGGHFLTAGWDLLLGRRYGLGCQSVIGGRVVLWNGEILEVSQKTHPHLLYAMRGGAVAEVGVVTEIWLSVIDQPTLATWRFTPIDWEQLRTCARYQTFQRATALSRDITVSFRFHFEPTQTDPVCSFNIVSLGTARDTINQLFSDLGLEVASIVDNPSEWNEKSLLDLRLLPASECLTRNPGMLGEVSAGGLHQSPGVFWNNLACSREMAPSFFRSISHWVKPNCDEMLLDLWKQFDSAKEHKFRSRMYALVIVGGGAITECQDSCSMPLGQALARFEVHWDEHGDKHFCDGFTNQVSNIIESYEDKGPGRPYRGDIWREDQAYHKDDPLKKIREAYS